MKIVGLGIASKSSRGADTRRPIARSGVSFAGKCLAVVVFLQSAVILQGTVLSVGGQADSSLLAVPSAIAQENSNDTPRAERRAGEPAKLQNVSRERLAMAIGHYARARSLLLAAIREFDAGYQLADPSGLIDSQKWRATVVRRGQELEKVLDPQPRISSGGVRYNPDSRLIGGR